MWAKEKRRRRWWWWRRQRQRQRNVDNNEEKWNTKNCSPYISTCFGLLKKRNTFQMEYFCEFSVIVVVVGRLLLLNIIYIYIDIYCRWCIYFYICVCACEFSFNAIVLFGFNCVFFSFLSFFHSVSSCFYSTQLHSLCVGFLFFFFHFLFHI